MSKKLLSLLVAVLLLLLMVSSVSAMDLKNLGVGYYGGCLSGKYTISKELSVQGLVGGGYLGAKANYALKNETNYNLYGYAEAGAIFNAGFSLGAGAGVEYFLFKALNISGLENIGFMFDLGASFVSFKSGDPYFGLGWGVGFHYYFK